MRRAVVIVAWVVLWQDQMAALVPTTRMVARKERRPSVGERTTTTTRRTRTVMMAMGVLARKAKEKAAKDMRLAIAADEGNEVQKILAEAEAGSLKERADGALSERLRETKALCVVAEYHRKTPAALRAQRVAEYEIPLLETVSSELRRAGASALAVNVDPATGGCELGDAVEAVAEQETARGDFPGPLPIVWADIVVDEVQLATAKTAGAKAVTLHADALTNSRLRELCETANSTYGLEPLIVVSKGDTDTLTSRLDAAVDAGPTSIILAGFGYPMDVAFVSDEIRPRIPPHIAAIANIDANADQGLEEAEWAWRLRDASFHAVYISDVLYKFGAFSGRLFSASPDSITSVVKAMRSKASANFARASASFSGKGEGAKEYLGDLLM